MTSTTVEGVTAELEDLASAVLAFAGSTGAPTEEGGGESDDDPFAALARRALVLQERALEPVRRLHRARSFDPRRDSWRIAPAVPTSAFKRFDLSVGEPRITFRSSGTTQGAARRSVHRHPLPELYRSLVDRSFPEACLPRTAVPGAAVPGAAVPILSLIPPLEIVPDSSLAFMAEHVLARWGAAGSRVAYRDGRPDWGAAARWLAERATPAASAPEGARGPVLVLTTALGLWELLDRLETDGQRFVLPAGSVLFETGGFKGRERAIARQDLVRRTTAGLGIEPARIVREYGMTELTSQAYSDALDGGDPDLLRCPPWMRFRVVDPVSMQPVADGTPGILTLFDLGNVGSVCHVATEDLAVVDGDRPQQGFRLLGRARGAELRGCSLTVEELARETPVAAR